MIIFVVVTLMVSLISLGRFLTKRIYFESVEINLPEDACNNLLTWYCQILSMPEGVEKMRLMKEFHSHILALGEQGSSKETKVISLGEYRS